VAVSATVPPVAVSVLAVSFLRAVLLCAVRFVAVARPLLGVSSAVADGATSAVSSVVVVVVPGVSVRAVVRRGAVGIVASSALER
jgi:hypothetical protein